jgi:hypothetical protein
VQNLPQSCHQDISPSSIPANDLAAIAPVLRERLGRAGVHKAIDALAKQK